MGRIYSCLVGEHDLRLVLVALLICLSATWTAFQLADRARATAALRAQGWLAAAGTVLGCGIWATHFVAMLAYDRGLPVGYDLPLTALSALIAATVSTSGFMLLARAPGRAATAGAVLGLGAVAMHYTGMAAIRLPAEQRWDGPLVALSILLGTGLAAAAAAQARRRLRAAALLTAAIGGLHLTGMAAFEPVPAPAIAVTAAELSRGALAAGITTAALVIIGFAAIGARLDRHLARRSLREKERLRTLAEATFEGLVLHAQDGIRDLNGSALALLGAGRAELLGRRLEELVVPGSGQALARGLGAAAPSRCEVELLQPDGSRVPVEVLSRPLEPGRDGLRVTALRDLRERRAAEERIRHLAHHDQLTGLPNRALFQDRLALALGIAERQGLGLAVLCLDLDRFKEVNDSHGHPVGDALLVEVARVLADAVGTSDTVARLGGDEFAILQVGAEQPEAAAQLAERLVALLSRPLAAGGVGLEIGVSVGVALFPHDGREAGELLVKADHALYRAKSEGRGGFRMFEPGMESRLKERRRLERELRDGLSQGQLALFFQPQAEAASGRILGFEALLRWPHPSRGLVEPATFIPLAEETGLIRPIGRWVLRTACAEAAGWPDDLRLGVNLSPVQFARGDLPDLVAGVLAETGLPPERLELEITEGVLLRDTANVLRTLERLKVLGVRIAMDDFGTGYSSLSYVHRFPVDRIKIDRSFVADLLTRPQSASIVRAIVGLGDSLGVEVVAEGVETADQLHALRQERCAEVQGYLVGRPMPAEAVLPFLAREARGEPAAAASGAPGPQRELATCVRSGSPSR